MFLVQLTRENRSSFFLMLWMAIMPLLCSTLITIWSLQNQDLVSSFQHWHWMLFYLTTILTMGLAITPTTFIALFGGYFLGWSSVPYMLISYMAASAFGFYLAKWIDQGHFLKSIRKFPNVEKIIKAMNHKQVPFIILCRISPILPFAIMNVLLSLLHVRFATFLWAGFLGMLPRTILFIWVGSTAREFQDIISGENQDLSQISFLLLLVLSIVGFYYYFKNLLSKKLEDASLEK